MAGAKPLPQASLKDLASPGAIWLRLTAGPRGRGAGASAWRLWGPVLGSLYFPTSSRGRWGAAEDTDRGPLRERRSAQPVSRCSSGSWVSTAPPEKAIARTGHCAHAGLPQLPGTTLQGTRAPSSGGSSSPAGSRQPHPSCGRVCTCGRHPWPGHPGMWTLCSLAGERDSPGRSGPLSPQARPRTASSEPVLSIDCQSQAPKMPVVPEAIRVA